MPGFIGGLRVLEMPEPEEIPNRPRDPIAQRPRALSDRRRDPVAKRPRALSDRLEPRVDELSVAFRDSKDLAKRSSSSLALLGLLLRLRGDRSRGGAERDARRRHRRRHRVESSDGSVE